MATSGLEVDSPVWIPDRNGGSPKPDQRVFLPGRICEVSDGQVVVQLDADLTKHTLPNDVALPRFNDNATFDDNTSLVFLHEASILDNLRRRHAEDKIYTYTASVLLAVNPYKIIPGLYGDDQCARYRNKHIGMEPPHPYAIAETTHRMLWRSERERANQAIIISGESGAGKTETAKLVNQYLSYASGARSDFAARLQARVNDAQPVLESFGNAATLRNSNSSRFGKYNQIFFNSDGVLVTAGITTYLLESSRVVVHAERERTYHIFYEMLAGMGSKELGELGLKRDGIYRLLHSTGRAVDGFLEKDAKNYARLRDALRTVGYEEEQVEMSQWLLAGLIHLAEAPDDQECVGEDAEGQPEPVKLHQGAIETAARLLGLGSTALEECLKWRKLQTRHDEDEIKVPRKPSQFRQSLHSFIKHLYTRLFHLITRQINASFHDPAGDGASVIDGERRHIGILDIYGFERLQRNSFEQLCINLANERLQHFFVVNVLEAEQGLYKREGLQWEDLPIPDSMPVVKCVTTAFSILDEVNGRLAHGFEKDATDESFCQRVIAYAAKDPELKLILKQPMANARPGRRDTGSLRNESFTIRHYAGIVEYHTQGWLDKNNDRLPIECEDLIDNSTNPIVKQLSETTECDGQQRKPSFRSISKMYTKNLEALLEALSACHLHYIRCFKPNEVQKPSIFCEQLVMDQIIQCGTIELVKIMHKGYPNRLPFAEMDKYRSTLPEKFQKLGRRTFIEAFLLAYEVPRDDWVLGMSKLFLKAGQMKKMEDIRSGEQRPSQEVLDRVIREIVRKRWTRARHAVQLCIYLPKMLEAIYLERATLAFCRSAVLTAKISSRLVTARQRIARRRLQARRRLIGCVRFFIITRRMLKQMREDRLAKAFRLAALVLPLGRRWADRGRALVNQRHSMLAAEKEAERLRRLEEQQRRIEEDRERLRKEQEEYEMKRAKEENLRKAEREMERLRLEEETRRQEEARAREVDERMRREDEDRRAQEEEDYNRQRRVDEEFAELLRQKEALEHDVKQLQENTAYEDAKQPEITQQTLNVLTVASPQRTRSPAGPRQKRGSVTSEARRQSSTTFVSGSGRSDLISSTANLNPKEDEQLKELEKLKAKEAELMQQLCEAEASKKAVSPALSLTPQRGARAEDTEGRKTPESSPYEARHKRASFANTPPSSRREPRQSRPPNGTPDVRSSNAMSSGRSLDEGITGRNRRDSAIIKKAMTLDWKTGGQSAEETQAQRIWMAKQREHLCASLEFSFGSDSLGLGSRRPRQSVSGKMSLTGLAGGLREQREALLR